MPVSGVGGNRKSVTLQSRNYKVTRPVATHSEPELSGKPYYSSPRWKKLRWKALQRDRYRCTVAGCLAPATHVTHIVTRPRSAVGPTPLDRLDNLRSLCATHDAQIKERPGSTKRGRGGRPVLRGCDADGWPLGQ